METTQAAHLAPDTVRRSPRLSTMRGQVLAVVLLTMLPAFALLIFNAADERARAIEVTRDSALATVRLVAVQQSQLIDSTRQLMHIIAGTEAIVNGNPETCTELLNQIYATADGYSGMSVAHANGDVLCMAPRRTLTQTLNTSHRSYFQKVMASKAFAIGDFQVGAVTGTPNLSFGYPVLDNNDEVQRVVWAAWNIDRLNELEHQWSFPQGTSIVLMDSQGTVVTHYPEWEPWVGKQFSDTELFREMVIQAEGTQRLPGLDGVPRWFAFTTVSADASNTGNPDRAPGSALYLAVGYSDAVLMQDVNNRLLLNLATLTLVVLVGMIVAYGMTDWMIGRRARRMMTTAKELQRGNWWARTEMAQDDGELGQLGSTLDEMADALQQRDQALQTLNAELEERVAFRTAELATANSQLRESQDRLRQLSRELLNMAELERTRVSNDVSDELGQGLSGIKMDVVLAQRHLATGHSDNAAGHLAGAIRTLDDLVRIARRIAGRLRPSVLDDFGLVAAVEGQIEEFNRQTGIVAELDADVNETLISKAASTGAFRILQEALTNIALHAQASKVKVSLGTDGGRLLLVVKDNGRGFAPTELLKPQAVGVLSMRERALQLGGILDITTVPGAGSTLSLTLPLHSD